MGKKKGRNGYTDTDSVGSASQHCNGHRACRVEPQTEEARRCGGPARGEIVQLDLLVATAELTRATAVALKYGQTNGEMKEGLRRYNEAIERFREFEREQLIEN